MEHIRTLETRDLAGSVTTGGCGECQTSCQSACKTSCGVANHRCENCGEKEETVGKESGAARPEDSRAAPFVKRSWGDPAAEQMG